MSQPIRAEVSSQQISTMSTSMTAVIMLTVILTQLTFVSALECYCNQDWADFLSFIKQKGTAQARDTVGQLECGRNNRCTVEEEYCGPGTKCR